MILEPIRICRNCAQEWPCAQAGVLDHRLKVPFLPVEVQLTGRSGNAYAVLAAVERAMKQGGYLQFVAQFHTEATAGDYDHLLATAMQWVTVL